MAKAAPRLQEGDMVRVVCPSSAIDHTDSEKKQRIIDGFTSLGLEVSFSEHCFDPNATSSQRAADFEQAFADPDVKAIWAGAGGFSSIETLALIDYKMLTRKILCGYSDITVLLNAVYAQTKLITYHAPNAGGLGDEFTNTHIRKALFSHEAFEVSASLEWADKTYTQKHPKGIAKTYKNTGWWPLNPVGIVEGRLLGGNITCLSLLKGTKYFPKLKGSVLLIEDDFEALSHHFAAQFDSLTLHESFKGVEAILIGRFQQASGIDRTFLERLIARNPALQTLPIIANVDFGHTQPQLTLPIGGIVQVTCLPDKQKIKIIEH